MSFSRTQMLAVLAALIMGALAGVLYVIRATPVHAWPHPPAALAGLVPEPAPTKIPAVAFADARGRRLTLAAFKGRYVLLNLWATWCAPCVRELPSLARLQRALPPQRLAIVAVSVGRSNAAETAAFLKAHGAGTLGAYLDSGHDLLGVLRVYGLPLTLVVDGTGREVARAIGPAQWDQPEAIEYLRRLTAPTSRPES